MTYNNPRNMKKLVLKNPLPERTFALVFKSMSKRGHHRILDFFP